MTVGSPSWLEALRLAHRGHAMIGWDFSVLSGRLVADEPWWDFEADCRVAMSSANRILDLGTGGGERLLGLLDGIDRTHRTIVATEGWEPNLPVARSALSDAGVAVIAHDPETGAGLPFPDNSVDLVMSRHEAFDAAEVARILAPGGRFLTQQVEARDAEEIHDWFDEPFTYPEVTLPRQVETLTAAGLSIATADEWQGTMEFVDAEALVTYLSLVPWDAPGFTVDAHVERLAELDSHRPIRVTQRRFRIDAVRP
ncbi:MAG: methyltransferase domain-containing protein [Arachnia propionica]|uniref:methyltransferase domain-containing protein n=1 Tax=Arachnia propionica TaxID=1750 RepID=UPI00270BA1AB|nr:methyltransferase domain-containing protein [Arachnia propionica]